MFDEKEFCDMFEFAISELTATYDINRESKGDGWKTESVDYLRGLFLKEFDEFSESELNSLDEYNEVLDIVLVGMMLLTKLDKIEKTVKLHLGQHVRVLANDTRYCGKVGQIILMALNGSKSYDICVSNLELGCAQLYFKYHEVESVN